MKKFTFVTFAAAALFAMSGAATAQYYSGPGYGVHVEPRYERDYDEPRYYRRDRYYDRDEYRRSRYQSWNGCPRGFTVQDGECRPYTGR